jgi:uncharacterized membrane protein YvbJ
MFCSKCGKKNDSVSKYCTSCGAEIKKDASENNTPISQPSSYPVASNPEATIKCGNCGYIGLGEPARKIVFNILAWICVVVSPLITIIYFLATHKYRCPKCGSTFIGIKNKEGVFTNQKKSAGRVAIAVVLILVGIAITGILASIILVSLNAARQNAPSDVTSEYSGQ